MPNGSTKSEVRQKKCPQCGAPIKKESKLLMVVLVILLLPFYLYITLYFYPRGNQYLRLMCD